ncbi:hypothetical protein KDH_68610 [Dictyobacter sp. S3.2.2.5]|uniref:DUF4367 domain-containing protein n=1 Tax=Dictyobacter halimunensis TaxID=3026934 RepID=A0ABQ6G482_9CHLR|nr:hypothetical protein KDH_68610 [Dictyobacter sp. S3.2.2.5]
MNEPEHNFDERWWQRLDAIASGQQAPDEDDDELLRVAGKLTQALSPLSISDYRKQQERQPWPEPLQLHANRLHRQAWRRSLLHRCLMVVALFLLFVGVSGACPLGSQLSAQTLQAGRDVWQASSSFEQVNISSVALVALKTTGKRPLLPRLLPAGAEALKAGLIADSTDPRLFMVFSADYRILEQELLVYEQPGNLLFPASSAQPITIGAVQGQLFQDEQGHHTLRWFQEGMTCQVMSQLPISELVAIARQFRPLPSWELLQ